MDELHSYVEKEREKGFSDDKIKKALADSGYSADDIAAAFKADAEPDAGPEKKPEDGPEESDKSEDKTQDKPKDKEEKQDAKPKKHYLLVFVMLVVLVGSVLGAYYAYSTGFFDSLFEKKVEFVEETEEKASEVPLDGPSEDFFVEKGAGCEFNTQVKSKTCQAAYGELEACDRIDLERKVVKCKNTAMFALAVRNDDESYCSDFIGLAAPTCEALVKADKSKCGGDQDCIMMVEMGKKLRDGDDSVCDDGFFDPYNDACVAIFANDPAECKQFYDIRCA
jgi:hypothetical protein